MNESNKEPVSNEKLLLSIPEVAQSLGLSERTIGKLVASNNIPSVKIGSRRLFKISAIKEWLSKLAEA